MGFVQDLKYALRTLRKNPSFVAAAVIVLALGIGANTATFSVVDALLLRPLPFEEPDRLVHVWHRPPADAFHGAKTFAVSPANYIDWKAQNTVFADMAAYGWAQINLSGNGDPQAAIAAQVEPALFPVLGVQPTLGRTFTAEEDRPNSRVIILSDGLWRSRYAADPSIIGRDIQVNSEAHTVVGVMPPTMTFPPGAPIEAWVPLGWTAKDKAVRGIHDYAVVARLKPGISMQQAQAEMDTISVRLEQAYPEDNKSWGAVVEPLRESFIGDAGPALLMMLGAVTFVLLIACANVANLVLARTLTRAKEISIRAALGASRARLMQQSVLETLVLALIGGAAGLLLARAMVPLIINFLGEGVASTANVRIDWRVLLFTFAVAILTGVIAGLIPSWKFVHSNASEALKQGGRSEGTSHGSGMRNALIVAEMALSLVLLIGAGVAMRSLLHLQRTDPGLDPRNVLTMYLQIPTSRYTDEQQRTRFFDDALARIRTLPGVESAAVISSLPVVQGGSRQPIHVEGQPLLPAAEQPEAAIRIATPGLFETLRIPIIEGRDFTDADTATTQPVVVIGKKMAERFWPGQSPVGKHLTLTFDPGKKWEVVGVAGDVKIMGLERDVIPTVYRPLRQSGPPYGAFAIRTSIPPNSLASAASAAIREIDAQQPVLEIASYESLLAESLSHRRFNFLLMGTFAAVAMLLSTFGIYSVLSYVVRRRTREIGIRMALGAQLLDVVRMVVIEGMKPTFAGLAIGFIAAFALQRVMASIVFGVSATDTLVMSVTALSLALIAALASLIPAYRATRVQPLESLRDE